VVGFAVLAGVSATPSAYDSRTGLLIRNQLLSGTMAGAVVAICVLVASKTPHTPRWSRLLSAASAAMLVPLAAESVARHTAADIAVASTAIFYAARLWARRGVRSPLGAASGAVASACDASALIAPVAALAGAWRRKGSKEYGTILSMAVFAACLAAMPLTVERTHGVVFAIHRDVTILLPILGLGLAGAAFAERWSRNRDFRVAAAIGGFGLLLALFGWPVQARLGCLPFWFLMPLGLSDTLSVVLRPSTRPLTRGLGAACAAVLAGLCILSLIAWAQGPLLLLYLLERP